MTDHIPAGSVVADVFCGVGPFAVPLALEPRACTVHANDLNPASYSALVANVALNRVSPRVLQPGWPRLPAIHRRSVRPLHARHHEPPRRRAVVSRRLQGTVPREGRGSGEGIPGHCWCFYCRYCDPGCRLEAEARRFRVRASTRGRREIRCFRCGACCPAASTLGARLLLFKAGDA